MSLVTGTARIHEAPRINVSLYWPRPGAGETIVNTFDNDLVQTYSAVPGGFCLREIIKGEWQDDWFYRIDPDRGVLEYADDYPKDTFLHDLMFWTDVVHQPLVPGKEIIWGNYQNTGDVISAVCETAGMFGKHGWQRVEFMELLPVFVVPAGRFENVLKLRYWQAWGVHGKTKGATMWFAHGLGAIKTSWETAGIPTGYGVSLQSTTAGEIVA